MIAASGSVAADWAQVAIAVIAIGGVLYTFFRWTRTHVADPLKEIPAIRATQLNTSSNVDHVKDLAVAAATMAADAKDALDTQGPLVATMQASVEVINHEIHSDDGFSLRDSINRNETMTKETADQVENLTTVLDETKDLVAAHIASDDERWLVVDTSLSTLKQGQTDAAEIAATK